MSWAPGDRVGGADNSAPTMGNESDGLSALTFNGEIYNFEELRAEMVAQGHVFAGHSDTEVLLRMLAVEGAGCLPRLAGMFAFGYWDDVRGEGLLARDAHGIKPLYFRADDQGVVFASEARLLSRDGDRLDPTALRDYFLWGSVAEPMTLMQSVRQLPAGHLLRWRYGEQAGIERWHQPPSPPAVHGKKRHDYTHVVAETRAALEESVRRHLVSDVPVGLFLSGGIDSTALLALTRAILGPDADVRTFSIGFDDPAYDESALARQTAAHFGARHTEWRLTPEQGTAEIPAFLAAVDQPSIDGFNTWCVAKLARREGMKVVLSGLGGDEWFAGYGSFQRVPMFHRWYQRLGVARPVMGWLLQQMPAGSRWRRLADFFQGEGSWLHAFHAQRGIFTVDEATELATRLAGEPPPSSPQWTSADLPADPVSIVSHLEVHRYMRNQLLRDSDVFSMAHGLELRVPLVDARLSEVLLRLSPEDRLQHGKKLLLDAIPEIPAWVRNQPKRGFRFPFDVWVKDHFGGLLEQAEALSSVPLKAWYRTWAVAAVSSVLNQQKKDQA